MELTSSNIQESQQKTDAAFAFALAAMMQEAPCVLSGDECFLKMILTLSNNLCSNMCVTALFTLPDPLSLLCHGEFRTR